MCQVSSILLLINLPRSLLLPWQLTAAAAVSLSGGPTCKVLVGRPDASIPDPLAIVPSPCDDIGGLLGKYVRKGTHPQNLFLLQTFTKMIN